MARRAMGWHSASRGLAAWATLALAALPAAAQQIHRQNFEGRETVLAIDSTDDRAFELREHGLVRAPVHGGRQAERLAARIASGNRCLVRYDGIKALVFEDLAISVWLQASKPGTQLLARVVLPRCLDPATNAPQTVVVRGDTLETAGRMRQLTLARLDRQLAEQQALLQAQRQQAVDIRGAYVDQVLFNISSGIGDVEVVFDDLELGPVVPPSPDSAPAAPGSPGAGLAKEEFGDGGVMQAPAVRDGRALAEAAVTGGRLEVGGKPFFLRAIRRSDAPLERLQEAGFNAAIMDWPVPPDLADEAQERSLRVLPALPVVGGAGGFAGNGTAARLASAQKFELDQGRPPFAVLVGRGLDRDTRGWVGNISRSLRAADASRTRPLAGDVEEGLRAYSESLDMVGVRRLPLHSSLPLPDYLEFVVQRRRLVRPGTLVWTWVQTELPDEVLRLLCGHGLEKPFARPVGPHADQLRLLTYTALAAGARGVAFTNDRSLSDDCQGRDRMLQLALLNVELRLMEPFLAAGKAPVLIDTSRPGVKAAVFDHPRGTLVLLFWADHEAHYVLGPAAAGEVSVRVSVPDSAKAFQVTLADVKGLARQRVPGGVRLTVPNFDTCALVVVTTDTLLQPHYQTAAAQVGPQAAAWQAELADIALARAEEAHARLEALGHGAPEARFHLEKARAALADGRNALNRRDPRDALVRLQESQRGVRLVQQDCWRRAVRGVEHPTSQPFLVDFHTLPEHYQLLAAARTAQFVSANLPAGDFERNGDLDSVGWAYFPATSDPLDLRADLVTDQPAAGRRALRLKAAPLDPAAPPKVVEHTRVEMVSPPISVRAGQLVRIRGQARVAKAPAGSVDGAMVWDSLGGETLALRLAAKPGWQNFEMLRPVRQAGELRISLCLCGMGQADFDELVVELADDVALPTADGPAR